MDVTTLCRVLRSDRLSERVETYLTDLFHEIKGRVDRYEDIGIDRKVWTFLCDRFLGWVSYTPETLKGDYDA